MVGYIYNLPTLKGTYIFFRNYGKIKAMDKIIDYAPLILAVTMFFINYKVFTTPADLEKKHREIKEEINPEKRHREILEDVDRKYATKSVVSELQTQIHNMADKVDKIYNILIDRQ